MEKSPVSKPGSNAILLTIIALFPPLLLLPLIWEAWRQGEISISGFWIVLGGHFLLTALFIGYAAQQRWRWGWLWLGALLLMPLWSALLDTSPARIVQLLTLGTLLVIWSVSLSGNEVRQMVTKLAAVILAAAVVTGALSFQVKESFTGPCHALSQLRREGCARSFPLVYYAPVYFAKDVVTDSDMLVYPYGYRIWLDPVDRWSALWRGQTIELDYWVSMARVTEDGAHLIASRWDTRSAMSETGELIFLPFWISHQTLFSLPDRELLDEARFDGPSDQETSVYLQAHLFANQQSDGRKWSVRSQTWRAIFFEDTTISFWPLEPEPPLTQLQPIDALPQPLLAPEAAPYWTLTTGMKIDCLSFSPDESLVLTYAGNGYDQLDVYDLVKQELILSIPIQLSTPCPVFSADGRLIAAVDSLEANRLYLIGASVGDLKAIVELLPQASVASLDFAQDGPYLVLSIDGSYRQKYALLFHTDKAVNH